MKCLIKYSSEHFLRKEEVRAGRPVPFKSPQWLDEMFSNHF